MKLRNLFEDDTKFFQHLKTNLIVEVTDEDGTMKSEFYIISDVPRISEEQFDKLYEVSFKAKPPRSFLILDRVDSYESKYRPHMVFDMTWKKFVKYMQEYWHEYYDDPDDTDDFDE